MVNRVEYRSPVSALLRDTRVTSTRARPAIVEFRVSAPTEGIAGLEDFVFVFDLVTEDLDTARQIDLTAFAQVEKRPRNRQHQFVVNCLAPFPSGRSTQVLRRSMKLKLRYKASMRGISHPAAVAAAKGWA